MRITKIVRGLEMTRTLLCSQEGFSSDLTFEQNHEREKVESGAYIAGEKGRMNAKAYELGACGGYSENIKVQLEPSEWEGELEAVDQDRDSGFISDRLSQVEALCCTTCVILNRKRSQCIRAYLCMCIIVIVKILKI